MLDDKTNLEVQHNTKELCNTADVRKSVGELRSEARCYIVWQ